MPVNNQEIGSTSPKTGTFQRDVHRMQGITLMIPVAAGVTTVPHTRIVSIQQNNTTKNIVAVISPAAVSGYTIIGWGCIEVALQSGTLSSIAPDPNTYTDGSTVTVLRDHLQWYMIDYDSSNPPIEGVGTAYVDVQGRLTSVSSGSNYALPGAVFSGQYGVEMSGQLKTGTKYYQMRNPLVG